MSQSVWLISLQNGLVKTPSVDIRLLIPSKYSGKIAFSCASCPSNITETFVVVVAVVDMDGGQRAGKVCWLLSVQGRAILSTN